LVRAVVGAGFFGRRRAPFLAGAFAGASPSPSPAAVSPSAAAYAAYAASLAASRSPRCTRITT
jgi:hypothetical protein